MPSPALLHGANLDYNPDAPCILGLSVRNPLCAVPRSLIFGSGCMLMVLPAVHKLGPDTAHGTLLLTSLNVGAVLAG